MITRTCGICVNGYVVGGGYKGKTEELDNLITQAAQLMEETFHHDVVIRYNSDRKSGGAWIKDDKFSCQIGLSANLAKSTFLAMTLEQQVKAIGDYEKYLDDSIIIQTFIDEKFLKNLNNSGERDYNAKQHDSLQDGIKWILDTTKPDVLSAYLATTNA